MFRRVMSRDCIRVRCRSDPDQDAEWSACVRTRWATRESPAPGESRRTRQLDSRRRWRNRRRHRQGRERGDGTDKQGYSRPPSKSMSCSRRAAISSSSRATYSPMSSSGQRSRSALVICARSTARYRSTAAARRCASSAADLYCSSSARNARAWCRQYSAPGSLGALHGAEDVGVARQCGIFAFVLGV